MKKIILDTDILNEMDDQFALAYLISYIKQSCNHQLEFVSIAPFDPSLYLKTDDKVFAMKKAKEEVEKIFSLTNFSCPIYVGPAGYMEEFIDSKNEAVENIIKTVKNSNEKVVLIGIGCATNIGLALHQAPEIADNMEIIWLGGNGIEFEENLEMNFKQDIIAVKEMINSTAKLTILPARPVTSALFLSKDTSREFIKPCGKIGEYLDNLIETFSKPTKGSGRKLWDIGTIYEYFNREDSIEKMKTMEFRAPLVYRTRKIKTINDDTSYNFSEDGKEVTFVIHFDTASIIADLIEHIEFFSKN